MNTFTTTERRFDIDTLIDLLSGTDRSIKIGEYSFAFSGGILTITNPNFINFAFFYLDPWGRVQPHCPEWLINKKFTADETAEMARVLSHLDSIICFHPTRKAK